MWYTGSPRWTSGFQVSTVHTWHTPLIYTHLHFLVLVVISFQSLPSVEHSTFHSASWNMSLGTAPIPTQSEQGSQKRITNNNTFHSFSGRIHTYRQIHFATWVIFSLTLEKKKKNSEGRLKSGIKHFNQRRNSIIHARTTAYSNFTFRTIPGPWKQIFNWNEDSNIFHKSNFHCC